MRSARVHPSENTADAAMLCAPLYHAWLWLSYALAHPDKIPDVLGEAAHFGVRPTPPHRCSRCYAP